EVPADGEPVQAEIKVRARHRPVSGEVVATGRTARVAFAEPVDAITPGQAAVFYRGSRVLGGAWIDGSA
ncbi:MAG: tRNA 2-thiouridine(34) synthase MnmA, partial [Planctomycetes bacterium]|nr:tRNA 2-thiouridine(34) synthase MnmA [Planctomycetota bacterium]